MVRITIAPAKSGDCILLELGESIFLIDSGYNVTFDEFILPYCKSLTKDGKSIDKLIITHIDSDHIGGALKLLQANGLSEDTEIIEIKDVWHNSYRHLFQDADIVEINPVDKTFLERIQFNFSDVSGDGIKQISSKQGSMLSSLIFKNGYPWNIDFRGCAISLENAKEIQINKDICIKLLAPDKMVLDKLAKKWKKDLYKLGYRGVYSSGELFDDAFEFLLLEDKVRLAHELKNVSQSKMSIVDLLSNEHLEDTSVTNMSSIAFVIEYKNKRLLFTGDSTPRQLIAGLKSHYGSSDFPLFFDFIKVPHHGAFGNNSPELHQYIDSDKYCISTDGSKHSHPDLETIAWIVSREAVVLRKVYFNYVLDGLDVFLSEDAKAKYCYDLVFPCESDNMVIEL